LSQVLLSKFHATVYGLMRELFFGGGVC